MNKKKLKYMTLIFSFITLFSFLYKLVLAYLTLSIVLLIAAFSTLMVLICKLIFVKFITKTRIKKKKAYFIMFLSATIYSTIFMLFVVLKYNDIDISNNKTYDGLIGSLLIGFMILTFILSFIGLKSSLEKSDLMVKGLKEMTFISALADLVIIEEYVSRIVLKYYVIENMNTYNSYFTFGIGILMFIINIAMFIRFIRYEV